MLVYRATVLQKGKLRKWNHSECCLGDVFVKLEGHPPNCIHNNSISGVQPFSVPRYKKQVLKDINLHRCIYVMTIPENGNEAFETSRNPCHHSCNCTQSCQRLSLGTLRHHDRSCCIL